MMLNVSFTYLSSLVLMMSKNSPAFTKIIRKEISREKKALRDIHNTIRRY